MHPKFQQSLILGFPTTSMQGTVSLRSVHEKFLSAQPDGSAQWNRDVASVWEYFYLEKRQGGKITLKGAHGMYVSAQPDGSVQINRKVAPQGGWEEFTVEDRDNNVVCLKSCHGKYLSAQQDGTAQWNRDYAPPGGWEDIQFVQQGDTGQEVAYAPESIEILEDAPGKPAQMTEESTKNIAKIALVVGVTLFTMGLPLLIIGSISTAEDRLAMLIPGAVMFSIGIFVLIVSPTLRFGKMATTSEQDPASEIVSERKVGNINRFETDDTTSFIKNEDIRDEGDTNEPFWEIN
jgi:hypothetical protein